jgi:hypothetical protein
LTPLNRHRVAGLQAGLYLSTGIWPLAHRRSFEWVTGRKTDFWLAQAVGMTVAAIGLGLAQAASRRQAVAPELRTIGVASAVGLALIDVIFVARRRISPVYLLDAAAETALVLGWVVADRDRPTPPAP